MRRKVIDFVREILITQMNHWVLVAAALTLAGLLESNETYVWLWMGFGAVPLVLYFMRSKVNNFFLFFALHLLLLVVVNNLPAALLVKGILILMAVFYIVWSVKIRVHDGQNDDILFGPVPSVCIIGIMSLIQSRFTQKSWDDYYLWLMFAYVAVYFLYYFINRYLYFLQVNENSASNIPEKEIFISGLKQTLVYIAAGIGMLFLTANIEWLAYIWGLLKKGVALLLRFLFSFIDYNPETVEELGTETISDGMMDLGEGAETHIFWVILEKIATVVVVVGIIALVIIAVIKGCQYLWAGFHRVRKKKKPEVQSNLDVRESCAIESSQNKRPGWFAFLSNRDKVRKMYQKRVLKNKQNIVGDLNQRELEYLTAKECCDKMQAEALKAVYEKARYSEEEITAEDVKLLRAAEKRNA